ncbi:hypothetical protein CHH28_00690 [Bacterioplanes sanyensis]|uniref:HNH domain-containing protein n=1 Tax=Bacterioplanes sanyensis TaxID=1249553 RepID=A0A222FP26_9GAMM|nr:hypothetical protein [Bacterioplanes sanyensis]ASP40775.1 hypothetical protein CHH28_00690 [Bacterioplanes sanyensis]
MARPTTDQCQLCQRRVALTFHHLIPRKMHRRTYFRKHFDRAQLNEGIWVCRRCHRGIHKLYDEMTLAKQFASLTALQNDPAMKKHIAWVARQKGD